MPGSNSCLAPIQMSTETHLLSLHIGSRQNFCLAWQEWTGLLSFPAHCYSIRPRSFTTAPYFRRFHRVCYAHTYNTTGHKTPNTSLQQRLGFSERKSQKAIAVSAHRKRCMNASMIPIPKERTPPSFVPDILLGEGRRELFPVT